VSRGAGDRWLAGEPVDGVAFAHLESVRIAAGERTGARGHIALLLALRPEPLYLVTLEGGAGDVRVAQSGLRAV
jgi:hypothetical protein